MSDRKFFIFVSYRGSDQNWATELIYARLTEAFGVDAIFKAGNSIRAGETFPSVLRKQAASCPIMLVCIGPGWLTAGDPGHGRDLDLPDDWVRREVAIALQAGNHVIPLLIGNRGEVEIPPADQLPDEIRALAYHQAWRLVPGGGLDLTIPKLIGRLAELVPELGERRAASVTAPGGREDIERPKMTNSPSGHGVTYAQTNIARDNGTVFAVQDGNFYHHPAKSATDDTDGTAQR